ncbi:hypothetical protein AVEN_243580-1 [Araneus ventricosus]|uniref:Uncharacterized protein n=1 Tax=Araneus ventricosus TaxID=182803 RepID=A0A4Y2A4I1_ARAVE|nr:hypothetical protein AVEN_243580-1 [Araneus ventricosus]
MRPLWPSDKVSVLGLEGSKLKPDSSEDMPCIRGLFWDKPYNFELWSDDEDDTWAEDLSSPISSSSPAVSMLEEKLKHVHE